MKYYILILLINILGCAKPPNFPARFFGTRTDVSIYTAKFNSDLALLNRQPINVDFIEFYSQPKSDGIYDGLCSKGSDAIKVSIVMPDKEFNLYTYYVYIHEIGHCYFNKPHKKGPYIMNPEPYLFMTGDFLSETKRLQYIEEMITL